jgi:hypothetical protein
MLLSSITVRNWHADCIWNHGCVRAPKLIVRRKLEGNKKLEEIKIMVRGKTISELPLLVFAVAALVLLNIGIVFAQHQHSSGGDMQSKDMLMPGTYTAKVKAIVCGECGPQIQKTLQNFKELEAVTVDKKSSMVQFSVKKGSMPTLSDLQKALDTAAKRMGMGADYTLSDVKSK